MGFSSSLLSRFRSDLNLHRFIKNSFMIQLPTKYFILVTQCNPNTLEQEGLCSMQNTSGAAVLLQSNGKVSNAAAAPMGLHGYVPFVEKWTSKQSSLELLCLGQGMWLKSGTNAGSEPNHLSPAPGNALPHSEINPRLAEIGQHNCLVGPTESQGGHHYSWRWTPFLSGTFRTLWTDISHLRQSKWTVWIALTQHKFSSPWIFGPQHRCADIIFTMIALLLNLRGFSYYILYLEQKPDYKLHMQNTMLVMIGHKYTQWGFPLFQIHKTRKSTFPSC